MRDLFEIAHGFFARIFPQGMDIFWQGWLVQACGVPSRFMRKIVCRLRLNEVSRQ